MDECLQRKQAFLPAGTADDFDPSSHANSFLDAVNGAHVDASGKDLSRPAVSPRHRRPGEPRLRAGLLRSRHLLFKMGGNAVLIIFRDFREGDAGALVGKAVDHFPLAVNVRRVR